MGRSASTLVNPVSIGRVTAPHVIRALNGVKRCDPAQGVIDLATPAILLCVGAPGGQGSIERGSRSQ